MSFTLSIIGLVLGSIATLITLVFSIISLAKGKNKNAIIWGIGFAISISILIASLIQVMKKVAHKMKTGVEWIEEQKNSGMLDDEITEDWSYQERQHFLDTLQKYTNENVTNIVPSDYYANRRAKKAADSSLILPFVYPYSIRFNDKNYLGEIINEINDSLYLSNISQMAFDENFMIAKVDNSNDQKLLKTGRAEVEYILFDLRTREYLDFTTQKILIEKAGKIGYTGSLELRNLSDIYQGWLN